MGPNMDPYATFLIEVLWAFGFGVPFPSLFIITIFLCWTGDLEITLDKILIYQLFFDISILTNYINNDQCQKEEENTNLSNFLSKFHATENAQPSIPAKHNVICGTCQ